jgi:deoxyribodipyrimidine photo-lyase
MLDNMDMKDEISICWLRRDLRLQDNVALYHALKNSNKVLLIFILDTTILNKLSSKVDKRVSFIHESLTDINLELHKHGSSLCILHDNPLAAFEKLYKQYHIKAVYINSDYEPYAIKRDNQIHEFAKANNIVFNSYKDQVIFEKSEVMKKDGMPYTVFTPYAKIWKEQYFNNEAKIYPSEKILTNLYKTNSFAFPSLAEIGFNEVPSGINRPEIRRDLIRHYQERRDIPAIEGTSELGVHLRFGTISIRHLVKTAQQLSETWLNELIWREFFMMILYHFPEVEYHAFKKKYDGIKWRNNEKEFELWCQGKTGYPLVDAGMRQLNETGWMHNRVRMVVASFLTKHLLIDWRWGEAYFAEKLLDYELSSNNGNWQWAAGCGCDAAPYFRVFNPSLQAKKFDPDLIYIKRWIKNYHENYLPPIVDHEFARKRALAAYKAAL